MKMKRLSPILISIFLCFPVIQAQAQDSTNILPNTSVNVLSKSPSYVGSKESNKLSGSDYTQQQINNLESKVNILINKVKILEQLIEESNTDIININNTIERRVGKTCMQKGYNIERKHGEVYNVKTGGGDDVYYSTLFQCVDGTIRAIGQNNMQ